MSAPSRGRKDPEKDRSARLTELTARGALQRQRAAGAMFDVVDDVRRHRLQWRVAGMAATGLAAAGTAAWKLFGKSSPAAKIGRAASATSIVLGLGKAFLRVRKFL
ncbi:MAG: hypothetical protein LC796_04755 [Acidobacteria bacterium]|nr:hypothetical protein [Acidobacteriota bacterium]MCA1609628.1 hypothetical protein [Acidobacteriota bacterium]